MQNRYLTQFYLPLFAMVAVGPTAAHAMIDPVYVGTGAKGAENNPQILGDDFAEWKSEAEPVGRFTDRSGKLEIELSFVPYPAYVGKKGRVPKAMVITSNYQGKQRKWGLADTGLDFESYSVALGKPDQDGRIMFYTQRRSASRSCCNYIDLLVLNSDQPGKRFTLPGYTGDMWSKVPRDETGDGTIDFVVPDIRFEGLFADNAGSLLPPRLFSLRKDKMVDVSREPASRFYYRGLMSNNVKDQCEAGETDNAGDCAYSGAVAALAGIWPGARHEISRNANTKADWPFPKYCGDSGDAACTRYLTALQAALRRLGYLPPIEDGRNWVGGWLDFFNIERDGAIPLDVQQFIYDTQGCHYYGGLLTELPNGDTSEYVVDMIEEYCRDIEDEEREQLTQEIGLDLQKKYRGDRAVKKYLKFPFEYPADRSWGIAKKQRH